MKLLWSPSAEFRRTTNLAGYLAWLERERGLRFEDYAELHRWSVRDLEAFWQSIWDYYGVISEAPPTRVLSSREMPGARWFAGTRLNFAEHIFRSATGVRPALLAAGEGGGVREIGWSELADQDPFANHLWEQNPFFLGVMAAVGEFAHEFHNLPDQHRVDPFAALQRGIEQAEAVHDLEDVLVLAGQFVDRMLCVHGRLLGSRGPVTPV